MALLDEPQFAVHDRMWAKNPPSAHSANQSSGESGGQIDIGKVCSRPCEYFGVVGCVLVTLG